MTRLDSKDFKKFFQHTDHIESIRVEIWTVMTTKNLFKKKSFVLVSKRVQEKFTTFRNFRILLT